MSKTLIVYLFDEVVGQLIQYDSGELVFQYKYDYLSLEHAQAISLSLPLRPEPYPDTLTRPFFSGLIPEDLTRLRLARFLRIPEGDVFSLLAAVGGECAGALSFYPEGQELPSPSEDEYEVLDDSRLLQIFNVLHNRPLMAGEHGVRLSLAGVQDKLAVCLVDNKVALAKGHMPTTHILKPKIHELDGTVVNEVYCMTLAKRVGLNVPHVELRFAGKISYYLIERYDRQIDSNNKVARLHQEDFCQALSISPNLKYEVNGGPGVTDCMSLLRKYSTQPVTDIPEFLRILIFNYMIGNADAHGKNFSLLYRDGQPSLAPAYDLLSTAIYPRLSKKLAMNINGLDETWDIQLEDWLSLTSDTLPARRLLREQLRSLAEAVKLQESKLYEEYLERNLPGMVLSKIHKAIQKRVKHILSYSPNA